MFPKRPPAVKSPQTLARYIANYPNCQICGSSQKIGPRCNGGIHHINFKSHGGGDTWENIITLCGPCHSKVHDYKISFAEVTQIKKMWLKAELKEKARGRVLTND